MSLESEDRGTPALLVESEDESQKRSKISYTRDFLLAFCELDICKRLPAGFDASILSEFEDASHSIPERQRIPGGLQRYSSTSMNRVDSSSNYSRGSHGRWDTRSSGSNDRDGDSLSDRESVIQDSGRRYGNQSRRNWQNPEHDGLLGSGAFPRPSGHTGSTSAPRVQENDQYQLKRSTEPYHPPRFYKALPHSQKDNTDSRDDETFGSSECSNEDREEEEKKRRASFELMRKEQQKALQEKQKHPEKHKEQLGTDIAMLLDNSEDEKNLWSKSDDRLEDHVHMESVCEGDSVKCSFPAQAPMPRPLVPPGFASAVLEKNLGAKSLVPSLAPEVGNIVFEDNAHSISNANGSGNHRENEMQSAACTHSHEQKYETRSIDVPFMDANEKTLILPSGAEASSCSFSFEIPSYNLSLEAREGWADSAGANFVAEKVTKFEVGTVGQDQSTSILDKLFNNALAVNGVGSRSFVEHNDGKSDGDTWSAQPSEASKFAHWFLGEEKKPVEDVSSSKARDLLSLIVSNDNGGSLVSTVSDEKTAENIPRIFPFKDTEVAQKLITSAVATSTTVGVLDPFYHSDKPDACSGVITCEDLEQSILAEVKGSNSKVQHSMQGTSNFFDAKVIPQKADVDDHASQHLLSLLQKGTISKGPTSTPNHDMNSSDKLGVPDSMIRTTENVHNTEKALTLETLFGTAFMKELHSVEAPVSIHRGSTSGGARADVLEPHGLPLSIADDGFFRSTVIEHASRKTNLLQVPQPDKTEEHWLSFNDPRSKGLNLEADGGFEGRADGVLDIRLPEEESLISMGDHGHHERSQFSAVRRSSEPPVEIVDKLAALNNILKDERSRAPGLEGPPFFRGPYEPFESEIPYQHLHGRPPQFPPHQMNNARPPFHSLDQHAIRNPQIKFIGPESIHHDPQHAFPPNIAPHPFHGLGGPRVDPAHHSSLQHMPMPGNFPPQQLLHGLPRGLPLPHPFNNMPGYVPELNPIQSFALNHQQANYSGLGLGLPGSGVGAGNHPEMLERLIEMELRGNQKRTPPVAAGHRPGIYGPELDMAFRYR